jgi:phospholipase C
VLDRHHCSVLGPAWPNRLYWMTGTNDPNGLNGGPIISDSSPNGAYTWTTYAERLEAAGVSWQVFQEEDNCSCNMLENFAQFQNAAPGTPLYDENDGLFDHVPPPTPKAGTTDEFIGGLPIGGGFRVPPIIISPWAAGGWVCSEPFDHTSHLRFLERLTGVAEPNVSEWRRRTLRPADRLVGTAFGRRQGEDSRHRRPGSVIESGRRPG